MTTDSQPKCGECLWNRREIVSLVNGICPKCKADYRNTLAFKAEPSRAKSLRGVAEKPKARTP